MRYTRYPEHNPKSISLHRSIVPSVYTLAQEIAPGRFLPTPAHLFIRLLHEKVSGTANLHMFDSNQIVNKFDYSAYYTLASHRTSIPWSVSQEFLQTKLSKLMGHLLLQVASNARPSMTIKRWKQPLWRHAWSIAKKRTAVA